MTAPESRSSGATGADDLDVTPGVIVELMTRLTDATQDLLPESFREAATQLPGLDTDGRLDAVADALHHALPDDRAVAHEIAVGVADGGVSPTTRAIIERYLARHHR